MALDIKQTQKPVRKLRKVLKEASKEPTPVQVHELRTHIRRLEALISALALDSQKNGRRLVKQLARIRKRSGKVRDMDVLTTDATQLNKELDESCRVQLIQHLGAQRRKKAKKLHKVIANLRPKVRQELKQIGRRLENMIPDTRNDSGEVTAKATAAALELEIELNAQSRFTRQNIHPYRLKVKELRNVLRLAQNSKDEDFIAALGEVKDAIGDWHDWEELRAIADEVLDHSSGCQLKIELKRICDEKYRSAVARAEDLRKKYLQTSGKGRKDPTKAAVVTMKTIAA